MLVLTRKLGEVVRIGSDITVQVLEARAGEVKLGLKAPRDVQIYRGELYRQIEEENLRARLPDRKALELAADAVREQGHGRK